MSNEWVAAKINYKKKLRWRSGFLKICFDEFTIHLLYPDSSGRNGSDNSLMGTRDNGRWRGKREDIRSRRSMARSQYVHPYILLLLHHHELTLAQMLDPTSSAPC